MYNGLRQFFGCACAVISHETYTYTHTCFIKCWQNAEKQYVVIVKVVKINKNLQIKIKKQIGLDGSMNAMEFTKVSMDLNRAYIRRMKLSSIKWLVLLGSKRCK